MPCTNNPAHHNVEHNAVTAHPPNGDAQAALEIHNNERKLHGVPALQWYFNDVLDIAKHC